MLRVDGMAERVIFIEKAPENSFKNIENIINIKGWKENDEK